MTDKPLAKRKPNELRDLIEGADFRSQLIKALPKTLTPERFVRITVTAMLRNPKLMQCTRDSFFRCVLDLAAIGLEPDGRQAHLIPRRNNSAGVVECTLNVDYKGLKELLYRNGDILSEHSDVVGDLDTFDFEYGTNRHLFHKPNVHNRGRIFAVYSHIKLSSGAEVFEVMNAEEVESIRRRSSSANAGPWVSDWSEMAKKTVFRRLAKGLPLSPRTRDALIIDQSDEFVESNIQAKSATVGGRGVPEVAPEPEDTDEPETEEPETVTPGNNNEIPRETPQSPPEPVAAAPKVEKPEGPLTVLRRRLKESGFKPEELLDLLKAVRLVNSSVNDLGMAPSQALHSALEDWDSCLDRLKQERAKNSGTAQEEFSV